MFPLYTVAKQTAKLLQNKKAGDLSLLLIFLLIHFITTIFFNHSNHKIYATIEGSHIRISHALTPLRKYSVFSTCTPVRVTATIYVYFFNLCIYKLNNCVSISIYVYIFIFSLFCSLFCPYSLLYQNGIIKCQKSEKINIKAS